MELADSQAHVKKLQQQLDRAGDTRFATEPNHLVPHSIQRPVPPSIGLLSDVAESELNRTRVAPADWPPMYRRAAALVPQPHPELNRNLPKARLEQLTSAQLQTLKQFATESATSRERPNHGLS